MRNSRAAPVWVTKRFVSARSLPASPWASKKFTMTFGWSVFDELQAARSQNPRVRPHRWSHIGDRHAVQRFSYGWKI
jgi:hypothetical protein